MIAKLRLPTRPQITGWLVRTLIAGLFVALIPVPAHAAVPSSPRSVTGIAGNGFAKITFRAPSPNANITNYKFSIDSGTTYTTISPALDRQLQISGGVITPPTLLITLRL